MLFAVTFCSGSAESADTAVAAASSTNNCLITRRAAPIIPSILTERDDNGPRDAILILDGPTVLDLFLETAPDTQFAPSLRDDRLATHISTVAGRQAPAIAAVAQAGARVIATYDTAANALLVHATPAQLEALGRAPGVADVLPPPSLWPHLDVAAPLVGARAAQEDLGLDGAGVNIAILDTGIDYTHCAFGAPGTPGAYAANDPDVVEPDSFPFGRVVGGYDFAGTAYGGSGPALPDLDPLDENGHGTHVGSIAAGGCQVAPTLEPGIAKGANIVALKIFGEDGSTSLVASAIEWAIEANLGLPVAGTPARVDVMNLSVGNPWASDTLSALGAIRRATQVGIVVVASAGNSGPAGFLIGGPAADPDAIAVASTIAGGLYGSRIRVWRGSVPEDVEAVPADDGLAPVASPPLRAALVHMGRACDVDFTGGDVEGSVALIERGTCTFHEKLANAEAEGAVAAIVYDDGRGVTTMGSDLGRVRIPAYMISRADGLRLRDEPGIREAELNSSFDGSFERSHLVDVMSNFSSRGVTRRGDFKPDISAPGTAIRAAAIGTGKGSVTQSGTSMAAPMVAGGAAVVIQGLRRDGLLGTPIGSGGPGALGAKQVAAILQNGAEPSVWTADNRTEVWAPLAWAGAGRMDVRRAAGNRTLLVHNSTEAKIDAGFESFNGDWGIIYSTHNTVTNLGSTARRYRAGIERPPGESAGVVHLVDERIMELGPGDSTTLLLDVTANSADLPPYTLAGGESASNGDGRLHEGEHDAWIVVTEVGPDGEPLLGGDVVRMPIYFFGRPASGVRLVPEVLDHSAPGGQALVTALNNNGGQPGQVELFTLLAEDGGDRDVGLGSDVDLFGARVVAGGAAGARRIEFAVHTLGARISPYDADPEVLIDANRDGTAEWIIGMEDTDYLETVGSSQPAWSGRLVTIVESVGPGPTQVHYPVGVDVRGRWLILKLDAAALGFGPGDPIVFDTALKFGPRFGGLTDEVPNGGILGMGLLAPLTFDHAGRGAVPDLDSVAVPSGEERSIMISNGDPAAPDGGLILALLPTNMTGEDDVRVLRPGIAIPTETPSATPVPAPSETALPTATTEPTPDPMSTPTLESTSEIPDDPTVEPTPDGTEGPPSGTTPESTPEPTTEATSEATLEGPPVSPTEGATPPQSSGPGPSTSATPIPSATPIVRRLYYLPLAVKRR